MISANRFLTPFFFPTYTVAWFHTHTPTIHRTVGRGVGPSTGPAPSDDAVSLTRDTPGIAYDYIEDVAGSGSIPAGHPLYSTAQMYPVLSLSRRPTP